MTMAEQSSSPGANPSEKTVRAAVIYHYFAHYRLPVVRALAASKNGVHYEFLADTVSNFPDIKLIPQDARLPTGETFSDRFKRIANAWFTHRFLWQNGAIAAAFSKRYDAIVFLGNMYFFSTWLGVLIAKASGKRVLMWGHGFTRAKPGLVESIRGFFYKLPHAQMLYGRRAREIMLSRGFEADCLYVIYNSLDVPAQLAERAKLEGLDRAALRGNLFPDGADAPILFCIGRLTPVKQLDLLLDAMAVLRDQGFSTRAVLFGDGESRPQLEAQADRLNLKDQVLFFGAVYEEAKLAPLMSACDLCVLPGAAGLTVMHALSYGAPVVTNDNIDAQNPEIEAIEPGRTGAFFKAGDAQALASTIRTWLETQTDRAAAARACYAVIDQFYNPETQAMIIDQAVLGVPARQAHAQDLSWRAWDLLDPDSRGQYDKEMSRT